MAKNFQLNIRMDKEPELHRKMKVAAAKNNMSLNEYAITAFKAILAVGEPVNLAKMNRTIDILQSEIDDLNKNVETIFSRLEELEAMRQD